MQRQCTASGGKNCKVININMSLQQKHFFFQHKNKQDEKQFGKGCIKCATPSPSAWEDRDPISHNVPSAKQDLNPFSHFFTPNPCEAT